MIINFENYKKLENKDFLSYMENNLSQEDYLDFLESCVSFEKYQNADEDIQNLVNIYFESK